MSLKSPILHAWDKLVDVYVASQKEEFHPDYKKDPEQFRMLMRSEIRIEREMKKYFKDLSIQRIPGLIDWGKYSLNKKANDYDFLTSEWDGENLILKVLLSKALSDALTAGGMSGEDELGINIGWTDKFPPAIKFLNNYSLKLAKGLNDVTKERVKEVIKQSILDGDEITIASQKIADVIDDPVRARMISRTESVRAFSEGRLTVGREIGAEYKGWSATLKRCELCSYLDGQSVKIDDGFKDLQGAEIKSAPRHPNCRCLVRLYMKKP